MTTGFHVKVLNYGSTVLMSYQPQLPCEVRHSGEGTCTKDVCAATTIAAALTTTTATATATVTAMCTAIAAIFTCSYPYGQPYHYPHLAQGGLGAS